MYSTCLRKLKIATIHVSSIHCLVRIVLGQDHDHKFFLSTDITVVLIKLKNDVGNAISCYKEVPAVVPKFCNKY